MRDFTLAEIKEDLQYLFETKRVRDYNNSSLDAASRCFYEFENIADFTEELVVTLIIGQLLQNSGGRIFINQYNTIMDAIEKALQHENELDLSDEEKIEVIHLAKALKEELPKMTIEYNPKAK